MYVFIFAIKLLYLVPAFFGFALLRLWRWIARGAKIARASSWPVTDAVVESSFELDESSKRVRSLLKNLFVGSYYEQPRRHVLAPPEMPDMVDIYDDDDGNDSSQPWISGLHYSYYAEGTAYSGTYLLPLAHEDSGSASQAGQSWVGKQISVRYNPDRPEQSLFLESDGAPGKPRIPSGWSSEPYLTSLSLDKDQ
jgi:hypothetical protein